MEATVEAGYDGPLYWSNDLEKQRFRLKRASNETFPCDKSYHSDSKLNEYFQNLLSLLEMVSHRRVGFVPGGQHFWRYSKLLFDPEIELLDNPRMSKFCYIFLYRAPIVFFNSPMNSYSSSVSPDDWLQGRSQQGQTSLSHFD